MKSILAVDDQQSVLDALRLLLKFEGIACTTANSPGEALAKLDNERFDAVLIDLNFSRDTTSGEEGLDLLGRIRQHNPDIPILVMTAWGSVGLAVKAIRMGAVDFIEKPWENARLLEVLRGLPRLQQDFLRGGPGRQGAAAAGDVPHEGIIARSPAMKQALAVLARVAPTRTHVLLLGENGTGKGVLARHLHDLSPRAARPFVKINMGGVSENIFESEMFGHVRGAFTDARSDRLGRFEMADGGTLFLDEIGNVPISQQPKLLRMLEDEGEFERLGSSQTRRVDTRLVAATNADLDAEVQAGRFRQDLLYRLNTITITLPPLRDRAEDILPLAQSFLQHYASLHGTPGARFSAAGEKALLQYAWPGNVRELQHAIERAVLLGDGAEIGPESVDGGKATASDDPERMTLDESEKWLIQRCLDRYGGNHKRCAEALGVTRQILYRRMDKYGLRSVGDDGA